MMRAKMVKLTSVQIINPGLICRNAGIAGS
jgi:hypothetical protein